MSYSTRSTRSRSGYATRSLQRQRKAALASVAMPLAVATLALLVAFSAYQGAKVWAQGVATQLNNVVVE
jgi:hypothetical protein